MFKTINMSCYFSLKSLQTLNIYFPQVLLFISANIYLNIPLQFALISSSLYSIINSVHLIKSALIFINSKCYSILAFLVK